MTTTSEIRHRTADGVELALWRRAGSRPPAILLVHGLASNARLWDGVATRLGQAGYPTVQVDLRGHGRSGKPDIGYDFATMAADLAGLIEDPPQGQVIAAGQSFGGNLVMELAARHPDLVGGVVCVDGGFVDLGRGFESWEACVDALTPPPLHGITWKQARQRWCDLDSFPPEAVSAQLANLEESPDGTIRRRLSLDHHLALLRAMFDQDPRVVARKVGVPVLVVFADDGSRPDKDLQATAFVSQLRRGRLRRVTGHHDLHAQQPDNVAQLMLGAIDEGFLG
ncbi:MAG: alpha/beta fold hydrolase [Actinomycetota bacterium]